MLKTQNLILKIYIRLLHKLKEYDTGNRNTGAGTLSFH
jgi:hypothetical protein